MLGALPNIGLPELAIIFLIILLIFGPGKLPEVGKLFGKGMKNFKKSLSEQEEETDSSNVKAKAGSEESDGDSEIEKKETSENT